MEDERKARGQEKRTRSADEDRTGAVRPAPPVPMPSAWSDPSVHFETPSRQYPYSHSAGPAGNLPGYEDAPSWPWGPPGQGGYPPVGPMWPPYSPGSPLPGLLPPVSGVPAPSMPGGTGIPPAMPPAYPAGYPVPSVGGWGGTQGGVGAPVAPGGMEPGGTEGWSESPLPWGWQFPNPHGGWFAPGAGTGPSGPPHPKTWGFPTHETGWMPREPLGYLEQYPVPGVFPVQDVQPIPPSGPPNSGPSNSS